MALNASTLKIGDTHEELVAENLSRTQIVQYAGASGDYMPLHTDEVYAREIAGYPGVFAHGMLSMGATGAMLTNWVGDGRLTKYSARFTRQVWPGDDLLAKPLSPTSGRRMVKNWPRWMSSPPIRRDRLLSAVRQRLD